MSFVGIAWDWYARNRDVLAVACAISGGGVLSFGALCQPAMSARWRKAGGASRVPGMTAVFSQAVGQLASAKAAVCLGGIHTLERVARESRHDLRAVMDVLTAFVRDRAKWTQSVAAEERRHAGVTDAASSWRGLPRDVGAALAVIIRCADAVQGRGRPRVDLRGTNLGGLDLAHASLRGANLCRTKLMGANLASADLTGANMSRAVLRRANLVGAGLTRANLMGADLGAADLRGAELRQADMSRAVLEDASLYGANLSDATVVEARLGGACLHGATLCRVNFSGSDLSSVRLGGANLSRSNLKQATLRGAMLGRSNCHEATFYAADLRGADLGAANLRGANLSWADLGSASMCWADLRRAVLYGANLAGADLTGADLRGADLRRADLEGANLRDAILCGALLPMTEADAGMVEACPAQSGPSGFGAGGCEPGVTDNDARCVIRDDGLGGRSGSDAVLAGAATVYPVLVVTEQPRPAGPPCAAPCTLGAA